MTATDAEGDAVTFSISGTELAITSAGVLTFVSAPDYETKATYTATVTASDGINTATQDITVNVNNLNDNNPVITSNNSFTADENQTAIGTVTATDADGDDVTFTVSGTELAITSAGVLTFVEAPDYETKAVYTATVTASDGTNTTTQNITVNVTNVNDVAPVFTSEATFSAAENQTAIGTVTATDAEGDDVTFTISGTELEITSAGVLTFVSAPDYEIKSSFTATVTASDGTNSTNQDITVNVTNVNDIAPEFTSDAALSADENQTAIGTVTATDAEGDAVTFSISGTELAITSAGVLTFVSAPDYETKATYTATVTASDGINTATQDITVNVNNLNDNNPVITSNNSFTADENQTAIGTVTATDADGDDVTFTVSGTELAITSAGVLTFVEAPDYETKAVYTATVTASDGTNTTTQNITVNVTNVNDVAPVFTSEATFSAAENQTAIGTVTATDAEGDDVTFTISGTELEITSAGVLTFVSAPDYEIKSSFTATVTASDGTNSTNQDITVNVTNVNDIAPEFTSDAALSADENQTAIGTVTATDAEGDAVTFSISGTELAITSAGVLTFVSAPDYETKATYTATVTASDGINTATQDITVNVNNLNDNNPVITSNNSFTADENQTAIGTVTATDADGDDVTFTVSGTELAITSAGVLTFVEAPDYETKAVYTATVTASDGTNTTTQNITVNVTNVNDVAPVFTSEATFSAAENQTAIGTVTATDAEGDDVTFTISGTELEITSAGVLTFVSAPDYEIKSSFTATVTASDGTNSTNQDITVNVTNVNDNSPVITSSNEYSLEENTTAVGQATATDADGDGIAFSITSESDISIDNSSGVIYFNTAPDYETATSHSAIITVSDGAFTSSQEITISVTDADEGPPQLTNLKITGLGPSDFINKSTSIEFTASDETDIVQVVLRLKNTDTNSFFQRTLNYPSSQTVNGSLTDTFFIDFNEQLRSGTYQISELALYDSLDKSINAILDTEFINSFDVNNSNQETIVPELLAYTLTVSENTLIIHSLIKEEDSGISKLYQVDSDSRYSSTQELLNEAYNLNIHASDTAVEYVGGGVAVEDLTDNEDGTYNTVTRLTMSSNADAEAAEIIKYEIHDRAFNRVEYLPNSNNLVPVANANPIFISNSTFSVDENETGIGTVSARNAKGDALTYSVSGSEVIINETSGVMVFASAPDYESKSTYTVTVTATDGTNSSTQEITININDVREQTIQVSVEANNNGPGNVYVINGTQRPNLDLVKGVTYRFVHPTAHPFRFSTTADGTHGGGTEYTTGVNTGSSGTTIIKVTDNTPEGLYYYCSIHSGMGNGINLIDNAPPEFTSSATFSADENQTAIGTVTATDAEGAAITYSISGSEIEITSAGVLSFVAAPDYETKSSYTATITANDGTSSSTQDITVNINNLNDNSPSFTSNATFGAAENQTAIGTVTATDPDGDDVTFSVSGDELAITSSGVLTFVSAPDYETKATYTATVTASDGTNTTTQNITVNVTNINENPVLTNAKSVLDIEENNLNIYEYNSFDPEGDKVFYVLSGTDSNLFNIDQDGKLTFKESPDYEDPQDSDKNNEYDIKVSVTDDDPESSLNTTIKPSFVNPNESENVNVRVTNYDEDIISFSLTGDDGTDSVGPKIYITMEVDSYTKPVEIQLLLWRGETQYWTSATAISEENFIVNFNYIFDVPTNSPSGTWEVRKVRLIAEDNEYDYIKTLLDNKGFTTSLFLYNPNSDENDPELVSFGEFEVTGNDSDPSTNIVVKISAKVTDQENGLDTAYGTFMGPGGGTSTDWGSVNKTTSPNEASYEWILDPKTASGEYKIADLRFTDKAGNKVTLLTTELENYGDPYITINNTIGDNDTPQLSDFKLSGSVDENGRKTIILRTLIDNGAEQETAIKRQYLRIIGPDGRIDKDTFIQQEDGWWELSFELGLEAQDGDYDVSYWFIRDNALNNIQLSESDLRSRGFLTKLNFNEGVVTVGNFPEFTSDSSFSADENQTAIGTVTATDTDGEEITFTISGDELAITSAGVLTFISAPDYETKATYTATVTASDGTNSTNQDITVNVTNVNDNSPAFTSNTTFSAEENQTAIGTVLASDADGDTITFSISGSDIAIDSSAGVITFASAPNYESQSSYTATVTVSDGTNSTTQDITVNVTDVTEAVAVDDSSSGIEDDNIRVDVLTNDTFISSDVNLTATDGINMTVEVQNDATSVAEYGHPTIIYSPDANWFGTDTFTYTVSSGGESDQGTVTVTVTSVNDAPTITSEATFSAAENQTDIGTVTATDIEDDTLTYSISGSDISIDSSTGVMTFNSAPDYESTTSYSATVTVSDGTDSDTQDITVNITNVNDNSPAFTSNATFSAEENQTAIGTVVASDADGDGIVYSISGSDISIDASSGVIAFVSAPDYETTTSYSATVTASDGSNSTTQDIIVNVTDVLDTFKISGTAFTSRYMILDSDVPNTANHTSTGNEYGSAQAIQNPVTIVGHTGDDIDRENNNTSDAYDLFEINLTNNMYVRLEVSEYESGVNDLDLMLYNVDGSEYTDWEYTSGSTEDDETINLPSSGTILIQVLPVSGSSRYKLTVAQRVTPSSLGEDYKYQHTFISNEFIIGNTSNNYSDREKVQINRLKLVSEVDAKPPENFAEENLLKFDILKAKNIQGIKDIDTKDKNLLISDKQKEYLYHWKLQQKLKSKFPLSDFGFNYNIYSFANFSADPDYWVQWHFPAISAEAGLNAVGQETKNIVVAVLDTGSPPTDSSAWAATDFISGGIDFISSDTDPTDPDSYTLYNDPETGRIVRSHGVHVASTIGSKNDGNYINGFGIKVIPIKVLGDTVVGKGGTLNAIINGINYAAGLLAVNGQTIPTSEGPVKVINMSLGAEATSCPSSLQTAINDAVNQGITVVAAAGNSALKNAGGSNWPALCDNVISVANVTENLTRRADSDFNSTVDIAAPGDVIYAWDRSERIEQMGGTSMAAPIVSGVIANMYSLDSGLTPSEINSYISNGSFTYDLGAAGRDNEYGYGLIDFAKSANAVITQEGLTKTYAYVNPGIIDYGFDTNSIDVVLNKTGSDALSVDGLAADNANGLTYSSSVDAEGYGTYTLNFDRSSYPNGLFENKIYFNMSDGTSPTVAMRYAKGSQPNRANIGKVYIGLYNSSNDVVASGYLELDGSLAFETTGKVPIGDYYYIISTDIDNDGYICNSGEICEIYPLSDSSELYISVIDSDVTGDAVTLRAISSGTSSLSSFSSKVYKNKNNYQSLISPYGILASKKT